MMLLFLSCRLKSPNTKEQTDQELNGDLLSMRDLLSFAWQIAKGMSYLSEIKVNVISVYKLVLEI